MSATLLETADDGPTGYHGLKKDSKHEDWQKLKADYHEEGERGEVLVIDGHPVMEQWEQPYMERLAKEATSKGGKVLEVGFGLGLSATAIQKNEISEHIIIEANAGVVERGKEWAKSQPNKVTFMHGLWQDQVASLPDNYLDGVLYDTYPLNEAEQHTHQFDFIGKIYKKMKPGGVLTYCNLTSIGVLKHKHESWENLWHKTQIPHIKKCGFTKYSYKTFAIKAPDSCEYYAGHTEALVPRLEKLSVKKATFTSLKELTPNSKNFNVLVKVVSGAKDGDNKTQSEATIADASATASLCFPPQYREQLDKHVGKMVYVRNGFCRMKTNGDKTSGFMRIHIDRWGKIDFTAQDTEDAIEPNDHNISEVEYQLKDPKK